MSDDADFDSLVEKMRDSAAVVILYTGKPDSKLAIEIGAAVLLDMPILVHDLDDSAPAKLLALADELVVGPLDDPETASAMAASLLHMMGRDDDE